MNFQVTACGGGIVEWTFDSETVRAMHADSA